MTLAELIVQTTWPEVRAALQWNYDDAKESIGGYRKVLTELKQLTPTSSDMRLLVRAPAQAVIGERTQLEVVGHNGTLNSELHDFQYFKENVDEEYAHAEVDYSLSFLQWEEWLASEIDEATQAAFTGPEIVAHCIWDMTFHGFEQVTIQEELAELNRRVDELDSMTEEERDRLLIPADEVHSRLKSLFGEEDQ